MQFKVTGNQNDVNLHRYQLLDILIAEVLDCNKEDHAAMATSLTSYLQNKNTLSQFNLDQLVVTAFTLGYYYRLFLEKNNVEILHASTGDANEELDDTDSDESTI